MKFLIDFKTVFQSWSEFSEKYYFKNVKLEYIDIVKNFKQITSRENYPLFFIPNSLSLLLNRKFSTGYGIKENTITIKDIINKAIDLKLLSQDADYLREPQEPLKPKKKYVFDTDNFYEIISHKNRRIIRNIIGIILVLFTILSSLMSSRFFVIFLLFLFLYSLIFLITSFNDYFTDGSISGIRKKTDEQIAIEKEKIDKDYEEQLLEYNQKIETYKKALFKYRMAQGHQSNKLNNHLDLILYNLSNKFHFESVDSFENEQNPLEGKLERKFFDELKNYLGGAVIKDIKYFIYYPDICIHISGVCIIDIEIDEPYSLVDKNPIHYKNSEDDRRNYDFIKDNWFIVRFSEFQIKNKFKDCIKLIIELVNFFEKGNVSSLRKINLIAESIEDERWDFDDALNMIDNKYRENYLDL